MMHMSLVSLWFTHKLSSPICSLATQALSLVCTIFNSYQCTYRIVCVIIMYFILKICVMIIFWTLRYIFVGVFCIVFLSLLCKPCFLYKHCVSYIVFTVYILSSGRITRVKNCKMMYRKAFMLWSYGRFQDFRSDKETSRNIRKENVTNVRKDVRA